MTNKESPAARFSRVVRERNGKKGIALVMTYCYGKSLTASEKDELLICSRIAQQGA